MCVSNSYYDSCVNLAAVVISGSTLRYAIFQNEKVQ